jgi:hypothetical protein
MRLTLKYVRRDVAWSGFALVALVTDVVLPPLGDVERTSFGKSDAAIPCLAQTVRADHPQHSGGGEIEVGRRYLPMGWQDEHQQRQVK